MIWSDEKRKKKWRVRLRSMHWTSPAKFSQQISITAYEFPVDFGRFLYKNTKSFKEQSVYIPCSSWTRPAVKVQLWSAAGHEATAVRRKNFSWKKHKAEKGSVCPENKMRKRKDTEREESWSLQPKPGSQRREWEKHEKKVVIWS